MAQKRSTSARYFSYASPNRESTFCVTVTAKVLARFGEAYAAYLADVERFCATHQVPYVAAGVDVPFDELILRVFRRGGFLR